MTAARTEPSVIPMLVGARPRAAQGLAVRLEPAPALGRLAAEWALVEGRARPPFCLSWHWMGSWLSVLPPELVPALLRVSDGSGATVGLACIGRCTRNGAEHWFLNETGVPEIDRSTIEDNGILAIAGREMEIAEAALGWLAAALPAESSLTLSHVPVAVAAAAGRAAAAARRRLSAPHESPRPLVALEPIRRQAGGHGATLSRNTRYAIGRSLRLYRARYGPVRLRPAASPGEAQRFLTELAALHEAHWAARGTAGAFGSPFLMSMHRRLVECGAPDGAVELLALEAGDHTIGYLYNFRARGWVHAYQSGFRYDSDPRLKPGLVSHSLAIERALAAGDLVYDFMAGAGQHKRSLANASETLVSVTLRPGTWTARIGDVLRRVRRRAVACS